MSNSVDRSLVQLFNQAAQAARREEHAEALRRYREILSSDTPASDEFLATVHLRIGFCLMDLGRESEALEALDAALALDALGVEGRYELHFARGNTLGRLRRLDDAFASFVAAISAAEDLDDYTDRPARCWTLLLTHAAEASAWSFLRAKAKIARDVARLRGMSDLAELTAQLERRPPPGS